jgi:hypothetical protein
MMSSLECGQIGVDQVAVADRPGEHTATTWSRTPLAGIAEPLVAEQAAR